MGLFRFSTWTSERLGGGGSGKKKMEYCIQDVKPSQLQETVKELVRKN